MSEIKRGDLVMLVKPMPCCEFAGSLGVVFVVSDVFETYGRCRSCGHVDLGMKVIDNSDNSCCSPSRLKKIDPPATGELSGVPVKRKEPVSAS